LLRAQFPRWADLPIEHVPHSGTDNAIYRLGADMYVRLPRIGWAVPLVDKEQHWLPRLAPQLPLAIPQPIARGDPGEGYPWHWSVCRWIEGEAWSADGVRDLSDAARDLAKFAKALQRADTNDAPPADFARGVPLIKRDARFRESITEWEGVIDTDAAIDVWEAAIAAPDWEHSPVWIHGDLGRPGNLLVSGGRLTAVIDFGCAGLGDPACDVSAAWALFSGESREVFRAELGVDDATWVRARGWALTRTGTLPYYRHTNAEIVEEARLVLEAVLADRR
jgi:aminoglycoside phosphotransferase (APT) family kinase protein